MNSEIEQQIEKDIKTAMLAGEAVRVMTLRSLKSAFLYAKVANGKRDSGMTDEEILPLISKESKKRQESADLYVQGGNQQKADDELAEKAIIDSYLPAQLSEAEISAIIDEVIAETGASGLANMGQVIGQVKQKTGASADNSVVARLAKEKLNS